MENLTALKKRLADIINVRFANSVLSWDQQTYMPPGGARARAEQMATLSKLSHSMLVADETGRLLEAAEQEVAGLDYDDNDASVVRVARRDYDKAVRVPPEFVAEMTRTTSHAYETWVKARAADNFQQFLPILEKVFDLCRQRAEYLGYKEHIYDALLDLYEPGATASQVETLFSTLRTDLVPFVAAVFENQDRVSDAVLHRPLSVARQKEFTLKAASRIGYDLKRGRQDVTVHPFCITFSQGDVRITNRFDENYFAMSLFGAMHETGHATYEQGIPADMDGLNIGRGASLGVHESQSRLWENIVGRSRGFWEYFFPELQAEFEGRLDDITADDMYRAVNKVKPSLIRVEADEVTYCLHIMLRFEIEKAIFSNELAIKDAPEAWNAKMESYLGIVPPSDKDGVLQDIHWSDGIMGYFPTYAIGSMLSAQLYEAALQAHPSIPDEIHRGEFSTLLGWMNTNIHALGRKYMPNEVVERATGQPLQPQAYIRHLKAKFGEIYGV